MELKYKKVAIMEALTPCSNRTFMELKYGDVVNEVFILLAF